MLNGLMGSEKQLQMQDEDEMFFDRWSSKGRWREIRSRWGWEKNEQNGEVE